MGSKSKQTRLAYDVLIRAKKEAQNLGNHIVSTEHLLLAFTRGASQSSKDVFHAMGVQPSKVREVIEFIVSQKPIHSRKLELSTLAKKVLDLALDEARRDGRGKFDDLDILLGCAREHEGIASAVLESLGLKLERIRQVAASVRKVVVQVGT